MKNILKFIFLIIAPVILAAGCSDAKDAPKPEEVSDGRTYFKGVHRNGVTDLVEGWWKTVPESHYPMFTFYGKAIGSDTVYNLQTVEWKENSYGIEWVVKAGAFADTIWLISLSEGRDTLYYTSPGYPPRNSWEAVRISAEDFEKQRQEVLLNNYLRNVACPPEAVSGGRLTDNIAGRWKLIKDMETGVDFSCDEIIYDFRPDNTLEITSNHPGYQDITSVYDYLCDVWTLLPFDNQACRLLIDGEEVWSEVLEKMMFLGNELNPSAKVFIRIN
ncbi:MAG: hypothetical protein LBS88_09370 [Tannerellaceae bacterium]|jgi:hypothetical protein|nr:hypothetical protein [Tannerellaceae bacterium]